MESTPANKKRVPILAATALMWLLSAGLGLWAMYSLFNLSGMLYALLSGLRTYNIKEYYAGVLFGQVTILIAAIIWLAAAVISGEFYMKHAGERKSWVMMAWIFGIEIFLILLNLLFGG